MVKSFVVSGVELAAYVVNWAPIEEIKEVLLARTTLFTGELSITTSNLGGRFSPEKSGSLLFGRKILNIACSVSVDGQTVFNGFLKDVQCDHKARTATFVMQNILSKPADSILPAVTLTEVNPGAAMVTLIDLVGMVGMIDVNSFIVAGGPALSEDATISVTIEDGANVSLLNMLQQIADLCSIAVFVHNGILRAQAVATYQGSEANLRQLISSATARDFKVRSSAYSNFNNSVTVLYGVSSSYTVTDPVSIGLTGIERNVPFSTQNGAQLSVPDLASAKFFAGQVLQRSSAVPTVISINMGKSFMGVKIGDRFPITVADWGFNRKAFELIETHASMVEEGSELVLRSL